MAKKKRNWEILTSYYFKLLVLRRILSVSHKRMVNICGRETELSERRGSVWSRQPREQHCCEGLLGDIMQLLSFFGL